MPGRPDKKKRSPQRVWCPFCSQRTTREHARRHKALLVDPVPTTTAGLHDSPPSISITHVNLSFSAPHAAIRTDDDLMPLPYQSHPEPPMTSSDWDIDMPTDHVDIDVDGEGQALMVDADADSSIANDACTEREADEPPIGGIHAGVAADAVDVSALLDKQHPRITAWVPDASDDDLEGDYGEIVEGSNGTLVPAGDDEDASWDYDQFSGLDHSDQLGVEFEHEVADLGGLTFTFMSVAILTSHVEKLTQYEIAICRAYAFKMKEGVSDEGWTTLRCLYQHDQPDPLPSLAASRRRINYLAGIQPRILDCCINSCLCYTGTYAEADQCHFCKEPRFRGDGKARKRFTYIPLIPRLLALFRSEEYAKKMMNRHARDEENQKEAQKGWGGMKSRDVFDGTHYQNLKGRPIRVLGETLPDSYFSNPHDVALGLCTDGVSPFKTRRVTCWPLIVINYNLPTDLMFLLEYIMALGVIPGPNKPKDFDSFFRPFIEEVLELMKGVQGYDALAKVYFKLRAFLLFVFGDIPAVSMVMQIKGHNGFCPCRMCSITGLRIPDSPNTTYYVPHNRHRYPHASASAIKEFDPTRLPLRTHDEFKKQALDVQRTVVGTAREKLAKMYGIKGFSILFHLDSISFPTSFPYDLMHLILENLFPNLVLFWTGNFKGMDEGNGSYTLADGIWAAVGRATAETKRTVPSAYGPALPDLSADGVRITADMYSFWALYIGPVLLRRRFRNEKYYNHFVELVVLLHICLKFEITRDDIQTLRDGFIKWVQDYEKSVLNCCYVVHNLTGSSGCTINMTQIDCPHAH
jgi:hypothetical protein